jgi:glycosyltransferase involved in cell wall biosynthesis
MRVLMLSSDPTMEDPASPAGKRLASYRTFADIKVLVVRRDFFRALREGKEMFKTFTPDLVSAQDPFFVGLIGLMLARRAGVPLQVQVHTDFMNPAYFLESPKHFMHLLISLLVLPRASCVRAVSERAAEGARRLSAAPVSIVPIRVISPPYEPRSYDTESSTLLTVSRLTHEKRVHLALEALLYLPSAHLTIVGEGPLRKNLEARAAALELTGRVTFAGQQANLAPFYGAASVFVSTSRYEGYGMALMEAALAGLPIVATDAGIVGDVLRHGSEALVVDASVKNVADAVRKLVADHTLARKLGEAARARAAEHVMTEIEYLARYREAMHTCIP